MAPSPAPTTPYRASSTQSSGKRIEDEEVKPYVLVGDLGKGSFATVYKGYHEETRVEVAIKTVSRSSLSTKLLENLQSEIYILKSLSHRHITRLIDIVSAERNIYLIMEYCAGGDLTNYIKKRGRVEGLEYIPEPGAAPQYYPHPRTGGLMEIVVRSFLRQLARALKFLRQRNLIHRDIKPQNLLLKPASEEELGRGHPLGVPILKVADFGFARSLPNAMMAETLCGSPLYMAPEILSFQKYDAKADLWSVGAVLYEMSVGKPPFRAQNHIELLKKIDRSKAIKFPDEDPRYGEDVSFVPADVKILIRMLLKRNPVERASFEEFFKSTALANSKFPRPTPKEPELEPISLVDDSHTQIPEHHLKIPPEVLDAKAMIPPSHSRPRVRSSPGETEEDGLLRREYVLVGDTRAVEFNRRVDGMTADRESRVPVTHEDPEINAARRRPLIDCRVPPTPVNTDRDKGKEKERTQSQDYFSPDSPNAGGPCSTFPPPPNPNTAPPPTPGSAGRAASNALARALNLASKKLFGASSTQQSSPHLREYSISSSPGRRQIIVGRGLDEEGRRDPMEDELLASLEQLAQKTDVITRWADEMYEFVKAIPQKPLPDPSKFMPREGEPEKNAQRRRNADFQAEYNAVTCVAIYMLVMSFSQKGIEELRNYQEHMEMRHPDEDFVVSEGFDDALTWFKDHFLKCNDRVALVKTWLPAQYTGPSTWVDELVYNRALTLSRTAARKELLDQHRTPDECEKLYEESLWCLYALQDDLLQKDNPFMEEDRETISTWIKRTKLRLVRCRVRMNMNNRDRLKDARADKNLDDVSRIPAPWDVEALEQFHKSGSDNANGFAS
ncbi:hypothetical protein EW146_g8351 [Bondarzewia mesenterica]|uniref:non-specific serine/threonine protein kinase n=1 Tax=Bondarzewia mesenterica TaxID=1095465 RepID=A0A4S4LF31_9AGAM|nr:hypothetical protein EW146_g8351 [Bondarzewia mesenterica]